jgi:nitroreductase
MDILKIIKNRKSIRKYKRKPISKKLLEKIIEAGVWGPSVPSFLRIQPWRFVIIHGKKIRAIEKILMERSKISGAGLNIMLSSAAKIISNANYVILIYNSGDLAKIKVKYKEIYSRFSDIIPDAELSAISAAIQNMILTAESLGLGSCWLDVPLLCRKEINNFINTNNKLTAVLTLGFPNEQGHRAPRRPLSQMVKFLQ